MVKYGLALEGGAMRGMFTCGVLDVWMAQGVRFDGAAGISAGAVFGCNFKSGQAGRALRYNKRYCRDPRYCSLRSWIRTGDLYGADFCYRELPDELDVFDREAFRRSPMAFWAGATDVESGKCVFRLCQDGEEEDMRWLRASASMPVVSRPVEIGGARYLDGGIANAVPFAFLEESGFERNVIVLTRPRGYRKKPTPGMPLMRLALRGMPGVVRGLEVRHGMYNRQMEEIDRREREGAALVIRPPEELNIGHRERNPAELQRVYDLGRREAERRLGELLDWLG